MDLNDVMEQFICERIQNLMNRQFAGAEGANVKQKYDLDAIMNSFSLDVRLVVENLSEHLFSREAEKERILYVSGVKDGFSIAERLV